MTAPDPVEYLEREHVAIERVLEACDQLLARVDRDSEQARAQLTALVEFFVDWGDLCHHEKEESMLIPALVRAGVAWDGGELERIIEEHQQERYLIRVLQDASLQRVPWSREAIRHFVSTAQHLTEFLRQHITHERTILFPVARSHLSYAAMQELTARFERFDRSRHRATGTFLEEAARRVVEMARAAA